MEYQGKEKSTYYGVWQSCLLLIIVPIAMYFFFNWVFKSFGMPAEERKYCALAFGFLIGSLFSLSCALAGLFKGTFTVIKNRISEFFGNLSISFKFACRYYWENIKEYGVVFWIFFIIIGATIGTCVYSFIKYFEVIGM